MNKQPEYKTLLARQMRRSPTPTEDLLWEQLRGRKINGQKFRRQRPLDRYVVDFCCDEARLILEVDGSIHNLPDNREYDAEREACLRACGYEVLRFTTDAVQHQMPQVLAQIYQALKAPLPLRERGWGEG